MLTSKTLELDDYPAISRGHGAAVQGMAACYGINYPLYIPHDHRHWEYGSAMQAILDHSWPTANYPIKALEVGCGHGFLGPAMAMLGHVQVTEIEPFEEIVAIRSYMLAKLGLNLSTIVGDILDPPKETFDVVTCISVIEHIKRSLMDKVWGNLCDLVAPGGVLFISTDVGEGNEWHNHRERETHFDMTDISVLVDYLKVAGFKVEFDPTYHGTYVKKYTFARIVGHKHP